jgi:DNA-binding NtrC family response regulator
MPTTILLVDGDPLQAFQHKSVLETRFADVQRVGDAAEALCLVEQTQFSAGLGLVVTGHHTSGIGGPALVAELHSRLPDLPILVLGGAGETPANYAGPGIHFRSRPIANAELLALASQLLAPNGRKNP